ncbi:glycerol-3-phosphate 1-O-acyltransferase PlsY [candidate division WOR-3 bacterium]|nr:glycerol-3-phosphate 1-O-acyltransferase PlsY [candidate division WOR-3 bacterium]
MYVLSFIVGYLLGSIPFGVLIARIKGIDIRSVGSGNIGFTNVLRTCGTMSGLIVCILDVLKGFIPSFIFSRLVTSHLIFSSTLPICGVLAGAGAISGHIFSIWLKFRGGKGVATSLGVFLALAPTAVLIALLSWGVGVAVTRMVSVGSLLSGIALPTACFILYGNNPISYLALFAAILSMIKHLGNIKRLVKGNESRFGRKGR